MAEIRQRFAEGLWHNNSALVQLLGLCPLLAVSNTAINALSLGLATTLVLLLSNSMVSLCRHIIPHTLRIPIYVMIIAALVTCVQLLIHAYSSGLYQSLGIFIPLIVTNCIVIGRAEAYAAHHSVGLAALDGLAMGLGASLVLLLLGSIREILSNGTLFAHANQLLGSWATVLEIDIIHFSHPFLLAMLPPGAFIGLGCLVALKNALDQRLKQANNPLATPTRLID